MRRLVFRACGVLTLLAPNLVSAQEAVNVPLGGGPNGIDGLRLAAVSSMTAKLEKKTPADNGKAAIAVAFRKTDDQRRLLALEAQPKVSPAGAKAVVLRCRVNLSQGDSPRPALVLFDRSGGSWYKVAPNQVSRGSFAEIRISVQGLRRTAFSGEGTGELEWDRLAKVWVGLVLEGPAEGRFELSEARFTSEPYKPSGPLRVTGDGAGTWSVGNDPAARVSLTTPNEGPGDKPCMKLDFQFPGRRHMYAVPSTPLPVVELEGYGGLRFTYKATLPQGLAGLLVMLGERNGAQYFVDPPPPASADWTTVTIPFANFRLGTWSKDSNGKLDLEEVDRVMIGVHGTAAEDVGNGTIWATDIEFVP